jgi:hypothetical protein
VAADLDSGVARQLAKGGSDVCGEAQCQLVIAFYIVAMVKRQGGAVVFIQRG